MGVEVGDGSPARVADHEEGNGKNEDVDAEQKGFQGVADLDKEGGSHDVRDKRDDDEDKGQHDLEDGVGKDREDDHGDEELAGKHDDGPKVHAGLEADKEVGVLHHERG